MANGSEYEPITAQVRLALDREYGHLQDQAAEALSIVAEGVRKLEELGRSIEEAAATHPIAWDSDTGHESMDPWLRDKANLAYDITEFERQVRAALNGSHLARCIPPEAQNALDS